MTHARERRKCRGTNRVSGQEIRRHTTATLPPPLSSCRQSAPPTSVHSVLSSPASQPAASKQPLSRCTRGPALPTVQRCHSPAHSLAQPIWLIHQALQPARWPQTPSRQLISNHLPIPIDDLLVPPLPPRVRFNLSTPLTISYKPTLARAVLLSHKLNPLLIHTRHQAFKPNGSPRKSTPGRPPAPLDSLFLPAFPPTPQLTANSPQTT